MCCEKKLAIKVIKLFRFVRFCLRNRILCISATCRTAEKQRQISTKSIRTIPELYQNYIYHNRQFIPEINTTYAYGSSFIVSMLCKPGVEKMVLKVLVLFFMVFKNQKTSNKRSDFLVFMVFFRYCCFLYKLCA